jgi:hypothetical protein
MWMGNRNARTWIAAAVALVFTIAAMPGAMAMPVAPASHVMTGMNDCCGQMGAPIKSGKEQNSPCKDMAVCFGMMSCYGIAALPIVSIAVVQAPQRNAPPVVSQPVSGLTVPPDDPPPIA